MKSSIKKKIGLIILVLIVLGIIATIYIKENNINFQFKEVYDISFSDLSNMKDIQALNGKKVRILGYMSPVSPYGCSYAYITNKPYATNVFEEGKHNTIAVYSNNSKNMQYSNYPVYITGDIEIKEITDKQGYSYKYIIKNANVIDATLEQVNGLVKKYLILAQDDVLDNLNDILGQIDKLIYFQEYKELEYMTEENLDAINTEKVDILIQMVNNYNDSTYDVLKSVLEKLKDISEDLNKLFENKKYSEFINQKEKFEEIYYEFYYYIGEFSI